MIKAADNAVIHGTQFKTMILVFYFHMDMDIWSEIAISHYIITSAMEE